MKPPQMGLISHNHHICTSGLRYFDEGEWDEDEGHESMRACIHGAVLLLVEKVCRWVSQCTTTHTFVKADNKSIWNNRKKAPYE